MLIRHMNREIKPVRISVCQGPECRECGGPELLNQIKKMGLYAVSQHCQGLCHFAPIVHINQRCIAEATIEQIMNGMEHS